MPGGNFSRFPSIVEPAATRPRLWWQTGTPDAVAGCVFGQVSERDGEVLAPDDEKESQRLPDARSLSGARAIARETGLDPGKSLTASDLSL